MLDLNRLVGFVFRSDSHALFNKIKKSLLEITPKLDNDDMAVICGECFQSSGPITGAMASYVNTKGGEFIDMVKLTMKSMGEARMNCPKLIFIISDSFNSEAEWVLKKLDRLDQTLDYDVSMHVIQVHPDAICDDSSALRTIVDDAEALRIEVTRILEEASLGRDDEEH